MMFDPEIRVDGQGKMLTIQRIVFFSVQKVTQWCPQIAEE